MMVIQDLVEKWKINDNSHRVRASIPSFFAMHTSLLIIFPLPTASPEALEAIGFGAEEKYLTSLISSFADGGEAHQENATDESH